MLWFYLTRYNNEAEKYILYISILNYDFAENKKKPKIYPRHNNSLNEQKISRLVGNSKTARTKKYPKQA